MANMDQNNANPFPKWRINHRISAKLCSNDERLSFTSELFGPVLMLQGKSLVLDVHKQMTGRNYSGHWHYFKLANDGLYMAPEKNEVHPITWGGNGLIEELTSDASSPVKVIVYVWFNDEDTLRKAKLRTDVYETFKRMLARGIVPKSIWELHIATRG